MNVIQLHVKVVLRTKKTEVIRINENNFMVRLTSAPVDGKANQQLIKILAKHLDVAPSCLEITKGLTSRNKTVKILC